MIEMIPMQAIFNLGSCGVKLQPVLKHEKNMLSRAVKTALSFEEILVSSCLAATWTYASLENICYKGQGQ